MKTNFCVSKIKKEFIKYTKINNNFKFIIDFFNITIAIVGRTILEYLYRTKVLYMKPNLSHFLFLKYLIKKKSE